MPGRIVDLSDNLAFGDGFPHATFKWLRDEDPVHWHDATPKSPDGEGFWTKEAALATDAAQKKAEADATAAANEALAAQAAKEKQAEAEPQ